MFQRSAVAVAVLLLALPAASSARAPQAPARSSEALASRLDAMLAPRFKPGDPGATVIVVKDGRTVLRKAYGMADTANRIPLTPGTVLRLGSITKQFTAVAILMLADEGKLALNDPITRFFPDYPTRGKVITIEHLLTHTSGIVSYTSKPDYMAGMARDVTVAQMIDGFKNDPLEFEPGTEFRYNNSGYFLLGAIIEKVSGMPYARFLERRIFTPLGMRDTAYEGAERSRAPRALGYSLRGQAYGPTDRLSMTQPYAAGSLVSTVDDLAKWDAAITAGKLLSAASWKMAFTPYRLSPEKSTDYGYGWHVATLQGAPVIDHGGGINGFRTYALRLPQQRIYVAVLANSDSGGARPELLAKQLAAAAMGKPFVAHTEIALDAKALEAVAGTYETDSADRRIFAIRDGVLTMRRGERPPVALKAHAQDAFFIPDSLVQFTFERDASGKVTHVVTDQEGRQARGARLGDAPSERAAARIDPAVFDARVGTYQLAPTFAITLSRDGERYYVQGTGQPRLEIFPASDDVFFARAVAAEIRFEPAGQGGEPVLVLHQNGQMLRAARGK